MVKTYSMEIGGRTLSVEFGKVAELANGAVMVRYGDTVVLVTATSSEKPRDGIDFFPLSVDYQERFYSVGKFPGGYIKREGRPSEAAVLASRLIDRPIRPLFPSDYRNDVGVVANVLAVDQDASPEVAAMIGSSLALAVSDIPFNGPTGSTMIGLVDGELVVNPTKEQKEKSELELTVASVKDKVIMLEAGGNQVEDQIVIDGIKKAHEVNKEIIAFTDKIVAEIGKEKATYVSAAIPAEAVAAVKEYVGYDRMKEALLAKTLEERKAHFIKLDEEVEKHLAEINEDYAKLTYDAIHTYEKEVLRTMVLKEELRVDGRGLTDIRELNAEVDILPLVHGSGLFSRGQTQVLNIVTLSSMADAQTIDGLDETLTEKRYIHHYNFPSYSVGETRPSRGPGRREIGHGALAEKALRPVIPAVEDFPYAIRTVSEVLSSNGSTSQGSICSSTLSLMAAGVPITAPIAGISVGLITGETDDDYKIITDIQGLEDHLGDMDFKVAGSHDGITAIQLDMKVEGITMEMVEKSIWQTRDARFIILDEVMLKAIAEPRAELGETVPKISIIHINPEKIGEVIGPKGKTIDKIIEETGVKIDIEDDGKVYVCGTEQDMVQKAIEIIESIGKDLEIGATYTGKIVKIMNFGAFVEIAPGKEGLIHISKLAHERVEKVEDLFSEGDIVSAKLMEIDDKGRINLSRKAILPKPEKKVEAKPQAKKPEVKAEAKKPEVKKEEPKVEVKEEEKSKKKITDIFFKK